MTHHNKTNNAPFVLDCLLSETLSTSEKTISVYICSHNDFSFINNSYKSIPGFHYNHDDCIAKECSGVRFYLLLSPYLCFISLLYLDLYVLGDDALISWGLSCKQNI